MAKKKKEEVTIEELKAAAADFNSFMIFDKPEGIPFDTLEYKDLLEEVKDTAEELESGDEITAATANTLGKLGIEFVAEVLEEQVEVEADAIDTTDLTSDERKKDVVLATEVEDSSNEIKTVIKDVKKFRKMEKILSVAEENGINIPSSLLEDKKKLKAYVIGKLEELLEPKKHEERIGEILDDAGVPDYEKEIKKHEHGRTINCRCADTPIEQPKNVDLIEVLCDSIVEGLCVGLAKRGIFTANDDGTYSFNK